MNLKIKNVLKKIVYGRLSFVFSFGHKLLAGLQCRGLSLYWFLTGHKKPDAEAIKLMKDNVTFIYKSFERQDQAKKLFKNIQDYYPGVKVIITDDSIKPLDIQDEHVEIIHLPFNSGLSKGLNVALEKVITPYTIHMDDDELLTPFTQFDQQLRFLMNEPLIDLVAVQYCNVPGRIDPKRSANDFFGKPMNYAPKKLKIPHGARMDEVRYVVGKAPNIFIIRTDKYKKLGYDDNIRMIDHNDFFYRAAGNIVSVMDVDAFILHDHNRFNRCYQKYREDVEGDIEYIMKKRRMNEM